MLLYKCIWGIALYKYLVSCQVDVIHPEAHDLPHKPPQTVDHINSIDAHPDHTQRSSGETRLETQAVTPQVDKKNQPEIHQNENHEAKLKPFTSEESAPHYKLNISNEFSGVDHEFTHAKEIPDSYYYDSHDLEDPDDLHYDYDPYTDTQDLNSEWSEYMTDFLPDMLLTFEIPGRHEETFYQNIGPEPTLLRGGFFVSSESSGQKKKVKFTIIDPDGEVAYKTIGDEKLFRLTTSKKGVYSIVLSNQSWLGETSVTFILGTGVKAAVSEEDASDAMNTATKIHRVLTDIDRHVSYGGDKRVAQLTRYHSIDSYIIWMSIFEIICIFAVIGFQIKYMERLVSNRKVF